MSQQEFDNFKQRIKDWMDSHPEEYDCFEEEMNRKDNEGYQNILTMAFSLVPKYQKVLRKRMNQGTYNDISDIETLFSESKLADTLVSSFDKNSEKAIVSAMLAWLYFGKSFERMVERGEEMRKNPDFGFVEKHFIASTIRVLVSRSIKLGLRTKEDWIEHSRMMKLAESNDVMDWAIDNIPDEKKKIGRKPDTQILPEDKLIQIGDFLKSNNTQYDLACLKIALEEMGMSKAKGIKAFRNALGKEYGETIEVISERGIQKAYAELTDLMYDGNQTKNQEKNREYINQIKALLSN